MLFNIHNHHSIFSFYLNPPVAPITKSRPPAAALPTPPKVLRAELKEEDMPMVYSNT
jgi:hypothetical protein|tara:strand:- start:217 stop:387 length:171 start_codon:yes stop_codon:yes gene_type:complete